MKANVGGIDRVLRVLVGLGLLSLVLVLEGSARWWGRVGLVPLAMGTFRFRPAYLPFGLSTCSMGQRKA